MFSLDDYLERDKGGFLDFIGLWADERELDLDEPLEDFLQNERELTAMVACEPVTDLGLAEEVIRYHYTARPHDNAHIVYFRDEH